MTEFTGEPRWYICWDADDTIGSLHQVSYEMSGELMPRWEHPLGVRHGLPETLDRLSLDGIAHYVTSSAPEDYVKLAIARVGLTEYFEAIYGRETISYGWGKLYKPVQEAAGAIDYQAHMMAVGDGPGDSPVDLNGMVFLEL